MLLGAEEYPEWWKGVRSVKVLEPGRGRRHGLGTLYRLEWRSKLPYSLEFDSRITRIEEPHLLEGQASGELVGRASGDCSGCRRHRGPLQLGRRRRRARG